MNRSPFLSRAGECGGGVFIAYCLKMIIVLLAYILRRDRFSIAISPYKQSEGMEAVHGMQYDIMTRTFIAEISSIADHALH